MRVVDVVFLAVGLGALTIPLCSNAETIAAPAGGRAIRFADRVFCPDAASNGGWTVDPDGRGIRPPADPVNIGAVASVRVAPDASACASSTTALTLLTLGTRPTVDLGTVTLDVDAGQLTVRGRGLSGMVVHWSGGGRAGDDRCTDPQSQGGTESCTVAVARGLPADPAQIDVAFLPPGARPGTDVSWYDAQGRRLALEDFGGHPARVLVAQVLPAGTTIDVQSGVARVAFSHAEGVASVDCSDAVCDLDGNDLVIRGEQGVSNSLDVHVHLRPHVFLLHGTAMDANPLVAVPLQRCPVAVASAPPLLDVPGQNLVVRVGGRCAHDANLQFSTPQGPAEVQHTDLVGDALYVVIRLARVDSSELPVTVQSAGTVVGVARVATRHAPTVRARLELPGFGEVGFIPTNRDARVLLPAGLEGASLVPLPVDGVYTVTTDASGADLIRGVDGTAGSVALRLAYRDRSLPDALKNTDLAVLTEPVDRAIRVANLPVALGGPSPLVELDCGDGQGHVAPIQPGVTASIPYRARDTCRVILHRERLHPEDGTQLIQLTVNVFASDGVARNEATLDQRIALAPGDAPRVLYVTGVAASFDRVIVRASIAGDDNHYAAQSNERTVGPQMQWSVVFGTDHFRIYATTAIPTGLFRVADRQASGLLTLNAGALFRMVLLSREGHESAVGIEGGVMWVGIAGEQGNPASQYGEISIVTGVGVSIPIANQSRATQASINLHAWLEYEISRSVGGQPGGPFGFVFGPSISIGDVGSNF